MEISQIIPHIESLIFAADRPLPLLDILDLLNNALAFLEDRATLEQVEAALEAIKEKYATEFYAFEVRESGGGYQFLTKKEYYQTVAQLNGDKFLKRLSTAALETLAIVAYKQPISKGEIEHIRGVSTDYSIQKLLEKELIVISGRSENLPGKPLLYATSKAFMDYFGLNSPKDLPKLKEVFDDESIQPTLIGLEAEANEEDVRNMVVSENGELVEQDDNGDGPEAQLNGDKVSTEEIPVVDTPDKKNNDLQAKLFLPFDEETPQYEEEAAADTADEDIVRADDDSDAGNDNIVAGTEIPTMDEALAEEEVTAQEEAEKNEEGTTIAENTAEEEEVTYATDEELAAFMNAAADVVPDGEDEEDEDEEDEDEEDEDEEDEDEEDEDDEDEDDEDEDDEEGEGSEEDEDGDDEDEDDDIDEEDADSDDDDEDSDEDDEDDLDDEEDSEGDEDNEDEEEDDDEEDDDIDEEDTDSDDDDSDEDGEDNDSDVDDDDEREARDKANDDAAFAAAAREDFDGEDIDDEDFDEDNFEDDEADEDERR